MTALVWRAQPRQRDFLKRTEFECLYGGAAGGGKTDALLIHGVRTCVKHPGAKVMFLRRTFADLSKPGAAIDRSRELLMRRAHWHGGDYRWTFANGSVLQFGHLQLPGDVYSYQGAQFDCLLWDELTQFSQDQYAFLRSRVRATVPGLKPTIRCATNPGGIGHHWVRERWIDAAPWGQPFEIRDAQTGATATACFVPAKVQDNTALLERDPGYVDRLQGLPEELRRAYLDGDWDVFLGQYFTEWRRDVHVVDPFAPPPEWPRRRLAVDFGVRAPWCTLFFVRDEDAWKADRRQRWYCYREVYQSDVPDHEQAKRILAAIEQDRATVPNLRWDGVGDPSMWNRQASGVSIADVYARNGVRLHPANNDRVPGWQRVREYLAPQDDGRPALLFLATCVNTIRTLPMLQHDTTRVEDVDSDGEDHAADAVRYFVMTTGQVHAAAPVPALSKGSYEFAAAGVDVPSGVKPQQVILRRKHRIFNEAGIDPFAENRAKSVETVMRETDLARRLAERVARLAGISGQTGEERDE